MDVCSPPPSSYRRRVSPGPSYTHDSRGRPSAPRRRNPSHDPAAPIPKPVIVASAAISIPLSNTDKNSADASVAPKVSMVSSGEPQASAEQGPPAPASPTKVSPPSLGIPSPTTGTPDPTSTPIASASIKRPDSKNPKSVSEDETNDSEDQEMYDPDQDPDLSRLVPSV
ncbi:hypothetical protein C0989_002785 [Termitomyces sp. Mn162]|nr:hypothetical protein C0989_002785 [Termitomyces sp. Mn162]